MRYLSVEQIQAYARNEIPTDDQEWIETAGDAAELFLDAACHRQFIVAGSATTRVYRPNSWDRVRIHDCTSISTILNNGAAVPTADYQLEPLNGMTWAGETVPYHEVRLISGVWYIDGPKATVSVTATWGWTAIPARVKQAALIVAKEIIVNRDEVKLGLIGFSDVGGVVARTNPIVRDVINDYKRVEAFGVA